MDAAGQPNLRVTSTSYLVPPPQTSQTSANSVQLSPPMASTSAMCSVGFPPSRNGSSLTISGFPDPFAVATVNGEQTRTTSVIKKTLNPYWNESFDMYVTHRTLK
jgi:Ca2+-dependent lipid-binding protein